MDNIIDLLQCIAAEQNIQNPTISVNYNANAGDGLLGIYHTAEIKSGKKGLAIFVKMVNTAIHDKETKFLLRKIFLNEIFFYGAIYPRYKEFEEEKAMEHTFGSVPECYKIISEDSNEIIVLSNLTVQGFLQHNRNMSMNDRHIEITLAELAHFHAISFALKDQNCKQFKEIAHQVHCIHNTVGQNYFNATVDHLSRSALSILHPSEDYGVYEIFKEFSTNVRSFLNAVDDLAGEHIVVIHGDVHNNNVMFKYADKLNPSHPTKVCLLDWQLIRVTSPIIDIAFFIYCSCNENQMENINHFLRCYHNELRNYIMKLGSDPEKLYPWSLLLEQWKILARYGLAVAALGIKLMLKDPGQLKKEKKDLEKDTETMRQTVYHCSESDEWKRRMKLLIYHFVKRGLLEPLKFRNA